ncbi:type III PLP-dependent enzyme [Chitinispirillales bacterium ANBcel5]|uniref:type III PLP-dependent enzyme n=1 Tax=Cellulosispirillum alkaliphilum TaxID=3039283 RepID=UPI002A52C98C|nr:type III PLP-dependent enzyme [Chitinispirillales bacterium ANBcel5]
MDFLRVRELVAEHGTPTLFLSKSRLKDNYRTLSEALPGVDLYYAVKSNAHPQILSILDSQNSFFDVCSNGEIDLIKQQGISATRCIHTHPIKRDNDIRYALKYGITVFVVDNEDELLKFLPYRENVELLVRMSIQNPGCLVNLSHKFGVAPEETFKLIRKAHELGIRVKGISFHTGSQNESSLKYIEALEYCRDICTKAALEGINLEVIDIGGGFPIKYLSPVLPMAAFCQPINDYLSRYFSNYRIIAEPGRILSGPSMSLATRIMGRSLRNGVWWYYLDEGVYGSFSGKVYDHADYPMFVAKEGPRYNSVLAGPTCDSIDVLYENISLPLMEIGDLLLFESMGAYTTASASEFNGFEKAKVVVVE